MRCNLKCSYCFLNHSTGNEPTMFDTIQPSEWIAAMNNFSDYDVEFYMWGGEAFCIDGTYDLVKGFSEYDFVKWARIDSNMTYTKKIIARCPSEKIKILCSWHTEVFDFETFWRLIMLLKERNMVGMANFVASDINMKFLKDNSLNLDALVRKFSDNEMFLNVAADFNKGNDPQYREFITQYMTEEDWRHIHGERPSKNSPCDAASTFFTVGHDGFITSCGAKRGLLFGRRGRLSVLGNFFDGTLKRIAKTRCPATACKSIISYAHRLDNGFQPFLHLEDYVKRNTEHRKNTGKL